MEGFAEQQTWESYTIESPSASFSVTCSAGYNLLTRDSNFATDISECLAILTGGKQEAFLITTDFVGLRSCSFDMMFISMAAQSPRNFFFSLKQLLFRSKLLVAVGNFMTTLSILFSFLFYSFLFFVTSMLISF